MTAPNVTAQEGKQNLPRMLIAITHIDTERKLKKTLESLRIPIYYQCRGQGTAPSEIMDILGMRGSIRLITMSFLPKFRVEEVFRQMEEQLSIKRRGGGIAVTIPVTGMQSPILSMLNDTAKEMVKNRIEGDENKVKETSQYAALWVSVAGGYGDDVVEAARTAGATGGTMMKGKRRGAEPIVQYLGIPMQAEQDFVMMVVPKEKKAAVMTAISEKCGLKTEAHGVVLSMPVDDIMGLE